MEWSLQTQHDCIYIQSVFPGVVLHVYMSQEHSSEDSKLAGILGLYIEITSDCNLQKADK